MALGGTTGHSAASLVFSFFLRMRPARAIFVEFSLIIDIKESRSGQG